MTKKASPKAVVAYPRLTLASLVAAGTLVGMTVAGAIWVTSFFVFKSDFLAFVKATYIQSLWHDVGHQNMRVERLNDEVDRMRIRKAAQGGTLIPSDQAELDLWQKKLDAGAQALTAAQNAAKDASSQKPEAFAK